MLQANFITLHVDNPLLSAEFYTQILESSPVEKSPTFSMFVFDAGLMLGLWSKHTVEPKSTGKTGCTELCFSLENKDEVDAIYEKWTAQKITILQKPVWMDFGYSFTACDPDGHWLRVFAVKHD